MNRRIAFTTALATTFLSGSTAWACFGTMYGPAQTTPLDFLPLGVTAASISLLAMKADAPITKEKQLQRLNKWMVATLLLGLFASTGLGFDLSGLFTIGAIGVGTLVAGTMLPGLSKLRKFVLSVGMLFGFLGSMALFGHLMMGEPQPSKFQADPAQIQQVEF